MTLAYTIDGIADTAGRALTKATLFSPGATVRRTSLPLPGRHGAVPAGAVVFDEPTLALEWELVASTWDGLEEERVQLSLLLARPGDLQVVRTVAPASGSARARLVSIGEATAEAASPMLVVPAVLALPDVFFRGALVTTVAYPVPSAGAAIVALGGSAPIADAKVRVTGPATSVTITDVTSTTGLSWTGALPAGQYLYLDAATLTARLSASSTAWDSGGTDVSAGLDYPAPGPLQLWPQMNAVPSARRVVVAAAGTGITGATQFTVQARPAYL